MTLVEHARRELTLLGEDQDVIDWMVGVIKKFAEFGHSGGSAFILIPQLNQLLNYENLTPLTSSPEEWEDRSLESHYPIWQNVRNSKAFSEDGGKTYYLIEESPTAPLPRAFYVSENPTHQKQETITLTTSTPLFPESPTLVRWDETTGELREADDIS